MAEGFAVSSGHVRDGAGVSAGARAARIMGIAGLAALALGVTGIVPGPARADDGGFFDFHGSLGEGRHSRYVPPLSNPIFNESPYITTEAHAIYFHHTLPDDFVTGGGDVDLVALQLRLALTARLAFIATKDGYASFRFRAGPADERGVANIAAGFKYALISDPETESLLTIGARYEIPINDLETDGIELQGDGDGFVNVFLTGARAFDKLGVQASVGANFALDPDEDTSILHYSVHLDYEVLPGLFPVVELNGFSAFDNGNRFKVAPLSNLDGVDVLNFGSDDRETTLTLAGGVRYRVCENLILGTGIEAPITDEEDNTIFDLRFYLDFVVHL